MRYSSFERELIIPPDWKVKQYLILKKLNKTIIELSNEVNIILEVYNKNNESFDISNKLIYNSGTWRIIPRNREMSKCVW